MPTAGQAFIGDVEVLDPAVVDEFVGRHRRGDNPLDNLAEREREVLARMAEGRSNRDRLLAVITYLNAQ